MIRLILTNPSQESQVLAFSKNVVSIGRSPSNEICLADLRVSKQHSRVLATEHGYVYEDLASTNGSVVIHDGRRQDIKSVVPMSHPLGAGDIIEIAGYSLRLDVEEPMLAKRGTSDVTVMMARPRKDLANLHEEVAGLDGESAKNFLQLVRETALAKKDEARLNSAIARIVFETFPCATHLAILVRDLETGRLRPFLAQHRDGRRFDAALSQTIVNAVLGEGSSVLFTGAEEVIGEASSVIRAKIETAICAPLAGTEKPFGVMQTDIRFPGKGVFTSSELDLFTMFAGHVSLVLENLRLYQDQRRALESTINALVHSLSLKDPETALHSERVRDVSMLLGQEMGLGVDELEVLAVASILHDTGKQGVRDEVLFKPGKLTPEENEEVSHHAAYTQGILGKICYPEHLKSVPLIAAYHHEKMNGNGIYGIPGDQIPVQARIIAVADAFDAIISKRSYKEAKSVSEALSILEQGRNQDWDGVVLDALGKVAVAAAQKLERDEAKRSHSAAILMPFAQTAPAAPEAPGTPVVASTSDEIRPRIGEDDPSSPSRADSLRLPRGRKRSGRRAR